MTITRYISECWRRSKQHKVIGAVITAFIFYSTLTNITPFLDLDSLPILTSLPKIPLPWAVAFTLLVALYAVIHGGHRFEEELGTKIQELKELNKPNLEIVFERNKSPYFEEVVIRLITGKILWYRYYRVGIKNTGKTTISGCRLVLEKSSLHEDAGIHVGHEFQVMGKTTHDGEFSVSPDSNPSIFIDIIFQEILGETPRDDFFALCYAAPIFNQILNVDRLITLKLFGEPTPVSASFLVSKDKNLNKLTLNQIWEIAENDSVKIDHDSKSEEVTQWTCPHY
jgi:hypothetical protein